jgi:hypothetical protein
MLPTTVQRLVAYPVHGGSIEGFVVLNEHQSLACWLHEELSTASIGDTLSSLLSSSMNNILTCHVTMLVKWCANDPWHNTTANDITAIRLSHP